MLKFEVAFVIAFNIVPFFHDFRQVLDKLLRVNALLLSVQQNMLQPASVVAPYEIDIAEIVSVKRTLNMTLSFFQQSFYCLLTFYAFYLLAQQLGYVLRASFVPIASFLSSARLSAAACELPIVIPVWAFCTLAGASCEFPSPPATILLFRSGNFPGFHSLCGVFCGLTLIK